MDRNFPEKEVGSLGRRYVRQGRRAGGRFYIRADTGLLYAERFYMFHDAPQLSSTSCFIFC